MNRNFYWLGFSLGLILCAFGAMFASMYFTDTPAYLRLMALTLAFAAPATIIKLRTQDGLRRELLAMELGLKATPPEPKKEKPTTDIDKIF